MKSKQDSEKEAFLARAERFYTDFGPYIRDALIACRSDSAMQDYELDLDQRIARIDFEKMSILAARSSDVGDDDAIFHKLLVIVPGPKRTFHDAMFSSSYVFQKILKKLGTQNLENLVVLFQHGHLGSAAGTFLKHLLEIAWSRSRWYPLRTMEKSQGSNRRYTGLETSVPSMYLTVDKDRVKLHGSEPSVADTLLTTVKFQSQGRSCYNQTGVYIPVSGNMATLDACFYDSESRTAYLLQVTVSPVHDAKKEGFTLIKERFDKPDMVYILVCTEETAKVVFQDPKDAEDLKNILFLHVTVEQLSKWVTK